MTKAVGFFNTLARLTGGAAVLLGVLFWTGHAGTLIPLHMALGVALVLSLWTLAVLAALEGGRRAAGLVVVAALWGVLLPVLGIVQTRLIPGSLHWLVQVAHLVVGVVAIRLAALLAARARPVPASAPAASADAPKTGGITRARLVIAIVALTTAALGLAAYRSSRRPAPLVLSGTLEARDVQVGSLVGGRVTGVHVDEGARVSAGQELVTLEPDLLDLQIREQQAQRDQARARLALMIAGPRTEEKERARVDWQNAEAERARLETLLKDDAISRQAYDDAATAAQIKLSVLEEMERGNRPEDIAAARSTLAEAESRLAFLERQRRETVITAPADGVVQSVDLRPGDLVAPNQPVLTLLETGQLWVRVYVPETELGLVHVGQDALLTVDTFHGRAFAARVAEIRERGEYTPRNIQTVDQRTDLVFGVKVTIEPTPELKPGMAALVSLKP